MGLLNDAINHMDSVLFDQSFSESITYTQSGGDPVTIQGAFQYGLVENAEGIQGDGVTWQLTVERDFRSNFSSGGTRHVATVIVKASDIATPEYGDIIEFGGNTWIVREIFDDA